MVTKVLREPPTGALGIVLSGLPTGTSVFSPVSGYASTGKKMNIVPYITVGDVEMHGDFILENEGEYYVSQGQLLALSARLEGVSRYSGAINIFFGSPEAEALAKQMFPFLSFPE